MTKTLILLRHLKSDWSDPAHADRDRALAERGIAAGLLVRTALSERCPAPDAVLCSPARRARDTLAAVRDAFPAADLRCEEALYGASLDALRALAARLPEPAQTVLLIGHNPGFLEFAWFLARPEDLSAQPIFAKFPTGGVAAFALPIAAWADLAGGCGRLLAAFTPKDLERDRR
jgi:phosphohistidine phosphatase